MRRPQSAPGKIRKHSSQALIPLTRQILGGAQDVLI
jgi:hypothetical protein